MSGINVVVFDLDDTLIATGPLYDRAIERCVARLQELFPGNFGAAELRELQEAIDIHAVATSGFGVDRFPWSLAETYRVVTARCGQPVAPLLEQEFAAIGEAVYHTVPDLLPDAEEVLAELSSRYPLRLYTLGVDAVQREKVEHHGLQKYFETVTIVAEKTEDALRGVLAPWPPATAVVVGDSLRGEIAPAVNLGCRAVFVERDTAWRYHEVEVHGAYETIARLNELSRLLPR